MENGNRIICFEVHNREEIVRFFYEQESDVWQRETHKRGGTLEENIKSTLDTVIPDKMFVVCSEGEVAGFFTTFSNEQGQALDAFHIGKKFRSKDFIPQFWSKVKKQFNGDFATGIYEKNEAAINHLLKQGFIIQNKIEMDGEKIVFLIYKF